MVQYLSHFSFSVLDCNKLAMEAYAGECCLNLHLKGFPTLASVASYFQSEVYQKYQNGPFMLLSGLVPGGKSHQIAQHSIGFLFWPLIPLQHVALVGQIY